MDEECSDREIKGFYKILIHMYDAEVKNLYSIISLLGLSLLSV